MKRVIYVFLSFSFMLLSCHKTPEASFSIDTTEVEVGQAVVFNNNSHNGDRFEWDFGDGTISNDRSPVHIFTSTGSFDVTLTVSGKGSGDDKSSLTIDVFVPTLLEIEVREYGSEAVIPGASIILYPTIPDWENETNSINEAFTDADGIAVFSNLDPFVYYLDVWEETHDNYQLKSEDIGWIRTPEVLKHKITGFVAYVDIADHSSSAKGNKNNFIIKKLVRKFSDKQQPLIYQGTENWKEVYNRRSVK